jgi:ribulose-phosphate 3-epimerase
MEITPAILASSFREIEEKIESIKGLTSFVQIDITDGKFAGRPSWPLVKPDKNFEAILKQERGMPCWEDVDFEVDLMVTHPFDIARDFIAAGASRVIFQADTIQLADDKILLDQLKSEGLCEIGIAVQSTTNPDLIKELLEFADFFQVMTIQPIGVQGSPFDEKALETIRLIRNWIPNAVIGCDGAMHPETIELCMNAGATRFAVGSYIFKSENPRVVLEDLNTMVSEVER